MTVARPAGLTALAPAPLALVRRIAETYAEQCKYGDIGLELPWRIRAVGFKEKHYYCVAHIWREFTALDRFTDVSTIIRSFKQKKAEDYINAMRQAEEENSFICTIPFYVICVEKK